jgi:hypothetical protein
MALDMLNGYGLRAGAGSSAAGMLIGEAPWTGGMTLLTLSA